MSGHCKDCKWWKRWRKIPRDQNKDTHLYGDCNHPKVGGCEDYDYVDGLRDDIRLTGWENDGIAPGQDFGCVHFERKVEP